MAKTYVENARVERVFVPSTGGHGVTVKEVREVGEKTFTLWLTLWFRKDPGLRVGDVVSASGYLSVRPKVLDNGRAAADVNLNAAEVQSVVTTAEPPEGDPWASDGGWH
jgi:hypothetical protein